MSNLQDIQGQIEKLQKQANDIKARDFEATVQDILAKMQAFGITVKDLTPGKRRGPKTKAKATVPAGKKAATVNKRAGQTVAPKFRGPDGQTWTGRGLMPRWLSALVTEGQPKETFAIKD